MSELVPINFRAPESLRDAFNKATKERDESGAQVFRAFMRDYIQAVPASRSSTETITADERERRREAVKHARASVELEGFLQSPESLRQIERFINGEIDVKAFINPPFGEPHER